MFENKTLNELNRIAIELATKNQWDDEAIEVNKKIIAKESEDHAAYTRIAKCLLEKGDELGAYKIYKKVLEFDPDNRISLNFVKEAELLVRKEKEKKRCEEKKAKELDEKRKYDEKVKSMISEIFLQ